MCGISGIICQNNQKPSKKELQNINNLIKHRGPDDEGFFLKDNFAFGHRRLSILDLSSDGHQPMHYLDKYTITYNGEIYNYLELKEELLNDGYIFQSNTDTEVILASYDQWGEDCVNKFNGMWAFALYDSEKEIIFCSRDRFGIKPFYYTKVNNQFIFGSEIKQLLEFHKENIVNETILIDYLLYGLEEHTQETFFRNIYKLEQAHNLIYSLKSNTFTIKKYYNININDTLNTLNEQDSIQHIASTLDTAITLRLRSDVKVGTCLSGGLDSSSIAAIASKKYFDTTGKKFVAIHAKSIEKKTDESVFSRQVAAHCNLELLEIEPQLEDITSMIEEVVYTQEEPFGGPSIFMQYFVMQKAKEEGCTVMLDGQGGDETLFGYEGYFSFYFASLLSRFNILKYFKEIKNLHTFKISKKRIIRDSFILIFRNKLSLFESMLRNRRVTIRIPHDRKKLNHLFKFIQFKSFQIRELSQRNLPHLLRYEDKNSMRHSVETRLPFIDYKFVESAISMQDDLKFKKGYLKYLLRKVINDLLPQSIVWRKNKFGFEAPTDIWINSHKDTMIKEIQNSKLLNYIIEIKPKNFQNNTLLWKLYNVAIWEKVYKVTY